MALDYQTLLQLAQPSVGSCNASEAQMLKIGLLVSIVNTIDPMQATDVNTLLGQPNVACYISASNGGIAVAIELALLQLIALNVGTGSGSGAPDYINYAGPPILNPPQLQNIVVDVNGRQWQYFGGAWN
jgi:hypothetical protein